MASLVPPKAPTATVPIEIGQPVQSTTKKQLQRQVNAIVGWNDAERAPMAVAQTLLRINESQVAEHPYFVCERSVGTRYVECIVEL